LRVATTGTRDLSRLLSPKSIAFVGGRIAEMTIERCLGLGYRGTILPVHPSRKTVAGVRCYPSVDALPQVPDAAYIGVRRDLTVEIVGRLAALGAGGCVCYAAGFAEVGEEGRGFQDRLIEASGDMPLVGPNCFGFVNHLEDCALWPYLFGGGHVEQGVALISQSGNIAMNLSMNDRSVRFTHVIGTGNQAVLGPGDYLDALLNDDRVRAVGMYLEGLDDIEGFSRAAIRALDKGVPIVVLKVGRTDAGVAQVGTHTSSLSGSDALYDALFDRLGVIRVDSLNRLLETLKIFDLSGPLAGRRLLTMSCSGGEAAILADLTQDHGLETPPFSERQTQDLYEQFDNYVTVSNPFDYNTSIWGDRAAMERCFTTSMSGDHDAALLIYDHPTVEADPVEEWLAALEAFVAAHRATGMRAYAVCTITELLPENLRDRLIAGGVTPLQGLEDALFALSAAATYSEKQKRGADNAPTVTHTSTQARPDAAFCDESESKRRLAAAGLTVPRGEVGTADDLPGLANHIGYPVVVKALGANFIHKTEMGAVALNLQHAEEVAASVKQIASCAAERGHRIDRFLVERMATDVVAELIVGIQWDPQFGHALVIGSGGTLAELVADTASLLLPATRQSVQEALMSLKVGHLLTGFRGAPAGDIPAAVDAILAVADFATKNAATLCELDVNPLIILRAGKGVVAADALIRMGNP
jgi:acyl-CoA synthetase (NDP forming)